MRDRAPSLEWWLTYCSSLATERGGSHLVGRMCEHNVMINEVKWIAHVTVRGQVLEWAEVKDVEY